MIFPLLFLAADPLLAGWSHPPSQAKTRAYWWWLNGNVTRESIRHDLEEMADKGFGGAIITDAGGYEQEGNGKVPHGPDFLSPKWRELYRFTLAEAHRLGLEMSLNIQSGWNLGGPMVQADDAPKKLAWTSAIARPGTTVTLPKPTKINDVFRDLYVLAYPVAESYDPERRPMLKNFAQKALEQPLSFSAPKTAFLLEDEPDRPGEAASTTREVIDLTNKLRPDGTLDWSPVAGKWEVLRVGWTLNDHRLVSTSSDGWKGYALDPFDQGAFDRYWTAVVEPLIADAGKLAGTTLRYLHTDSWEVEVANWTPSLREEFRRRRGYDPFRYLPVLAGRILDARSVSNRFLNDLRRTMGDLAIDHHFRPFKTYAARHGIGIHPESGGPHAVPIDSIQCLGMDDAPMSEFWASSWTHRVKDEDRFFVKQPASAAHVYGHNLVLAEGFTTIGPHWQERLADNLKPNFEKALCEGMNRLVWHAFVNSPASEGMPGQQYFAGTHLNPNTTWWNYGKPFFDYLNRCQFMMQQGKPVADVLYYYGEHVPNFAQLKKSDPAHVRPEFDYDVVTLDGLTNRISVRNGRLVTPDGLSYRALVLPELASMSLRALRRISQLVQAGATVAGPAPKAMSTLEGGSESEREFTRLVAEIWQRPRPFRIGARPDVEFVGQDVADLDLDWAHRRTENTDVYFVASRPPTQYGPPRVVPARTVRIRFRVSDRVPELWDPVTGTRYAVRSGSLSGATEIEAPFAAGRSWFVVFRSAASSTVGPVEMFFEFDGLQNKNLDRGWEVSFDPKFGGPKLANFDSLIDWSQSPEPGIRFYSGMAKYTNRFSFTWDQERPIRHWLELGQVREIARVRLNGIDCGTVWTDPYRIEITKALRQGENTLEIEVVNNWANRIIGDAALPIERRVTRTNIRRLTPQTPLEPSGLLGPVRIL